MPEPCRKCGSKYRQPSPAPGLCWTCARGSKPTLAAKPIDVNVATLFTCLECGARYNRLLPHNGICWGCAEKAGRAAAIRTARRRVCGIARRHAKFLSWADLCGPPEYLRAVAQVRGFAERGETVLAVVGRRGLGKTQALSVGVWQTIERGRAARLLTALVLIGDLKRRFGDAGDAEGDWLGTWTAPHLLCIDEIGELVAGDHSRAMLAALIDRRYGDCHPTILAGNIEVAALADVLGASVASRCNEGGGAVIFDGWGSFRTRERHLSEEKIVGSATAPNSGTGQDLQRTGQAGPRPEKPVATETRTNGR